MINGKPDVATISFDEVEKYRQKKKSQVVAEAIRLYEESSEDDSADRSCVSNWGYLAHEVVGQESGT